MNYLFNIIMSVVFLGIAGYFAAKSDSDAVRCIMWLSLMFWSGFNIFMIQNQEKNDKLDEVKKNQEKIIDELGRFHNMTFKETEGE